jgi:cyclopropane fatty-acyl-phospholipid synthase-like methyltransferase
MADINTYYSMKITDEDIGKNVHRNAVGGLWEEIGILTLNFLRDHAELKPDHKILDLGCGSFRCGIPIMKYLNDDNYYAIDVNEDLVKAGFAEMRKSGLENTISSNNIHICDNFDARIFGVKFDIVIAQSLWTHLPLSHIERSLSMVEKVLSSEGSFYTTFFLCPADHNLLEPYRHEPGGIVTYRHRDPYHYRLEDFEYLIDQLNLRLRIQLFGDYNHPRNQQMLCFKKMR